MFEGCFLCSSLTQEPHVAIDLLPDVVIAIVMSHMPTKILSKSAQGDDYSRSGSQNLVDTYNKERTVVAIDPTVCIYQDDGVYRTNISTSQQVYYAVAGETCLVSSSQSALARHLHASLSEERIALSLCENLPSVLRQKSFWQGVRAVSPGHKLVVQHGNVTEEPTHSYISRDALTVHEAADLIRNRLAKVIGDSSGEHGKTLSCDLSGGMDSTSLAYVIASLSLDAVYYHASTMDSNNRDQSFSRRAAKGLRGEYCELRSFSRAMSAFDVFVDDIPPSTTDGPAAWFSNARYIQAVLQEDCCRGIDVHIVGLGGDELFTALPSIAQTLFSYGQISKAMEVVTSTAQEQKSCVASCFVGACSQETWLHELKRKLRNVASGGLRARDAFSWMPGFCVSPFATSKTISLVEHSVDRLVDDNRLPDWKDKFHYQVSESLLFQGEVVRQMNQAFRGYGTIIEAPFIDDELIGIILGLHPLLWLSKKSKPLLREAMSGIAPDWVFDRNDKGEYSWDLFQDFQRHRSDVMRYLCDGYLACNYYIDPDKVRAAIEGPLLDTQRLFALEQLVSIERWIRRSE